MTDGSEERIFRVEALARVEGEGAMHVIIRDGRVREVQLRIYEPPRFFEALLRGRAFTEPPDITARICGICPVAYQMSACNAIEAACGVVVDGPVADLRRLLYLGEWIESHVLHIYLLHAPDFLGYESAIELATDHRDLVQRGLDLKKVGNSLVELVGGRAIHPVNVRVGGFYRVPTESELRAFVPRLEQARDLALDTVRWVADFDFPDHTWTGELAALRRPGEYAITGGRFTSTLGLDIGPEEFDDHVVEEHVEHSTALHARLRERGEYLVGPLARFAINSSELGTVAQDAANAAGLTARRAQSISVDHRSRGRGAARVRRRSGDHRPLPAAGPSRCRGGAPRGRGPRLDRSPARDALASLRARRGRHDRRSTHRAPDVAEPGRHRT